MTTKQVLIKRKFCICKTLKNTRTVVFVVKNFIQMLHLHLEFPNVWSLIIVVQYNVCAWDKNNSNFFDSNINSNLFKFHECVSTCKSTQLNLTSIQKFVANEITVKTTDMDTKTKMVIFPSDIMTKCGEYDQTTRNTLLKAVIFCL